MATNFKEDLSKVKAFVFDVDGVFSTNNFLITPEGDFIRSMNIKDGYAVQLAVKKGYPVGIITGGTSESVRIRFNGLGVTDIYLGSSYKMDNFKDFLYKYDLTADEILYMGDDMPDYQIMSICGIPVCPADAAHDIKAISKYISDKNGGNGCVRDVIEQVMRAQQKWMEADAFQW
jgi:3-deoxy-D-manno-octulosonate 8-phosphate phosphatase (KDO 8-P phosphatase)